MRLDFTCHSIWRFFVHVHHFHGVSDLTDFRQKISASISPDGSIFRERTDSASAEQYFQVLIADTVHHSICNDDKDFTYKLPDWTVEVCSSCIISGLQNKILFRFVVNNFVFRYFIQL